ncbi:IDEAL domain-containing protein [Lysinibacillus sp. 54212]|uniref:IDEAL domain-containing protein n=1 Tax=Lysinibacillus sp. 54212 TaxID=3119829 RepID=UPI002FCB83CC
MDKYYSYTDFLRAVGHYPREAESEKLLTDIYVDLFLNRLQRIQRIERLEELIDMSLDQRNEQAFFAHTQELNELLESIEN